MASASKGKLKMIATGHKTIQKGSWRKRGSETDKAEQKRAKKPKSPFDAGSELLIYGDLKGMEVSIVEASMRGTTRKKLKQTSLWRKC